MTSAFPDATRVEMGAPKNGDGASGNRSSSIDFALLKHRSAEAQRRWSETPFKWRRNLLKRFRNELVAGVDSMAQRVADHRGCSRAEAIATEIIPLADAARCLAKRFTRLLAPKLLGTLDRPGWLTGVNSQVHRQPLGLILIIAPGNYPLYLAGVQVLQAVTAGNAVWLKPAPRATEVLTLFLDQLTADGLPTDLIQLLPESIEATQAAIECGVDKVVFTGSAETGQNVLSQLAPRLTPSVMELSGCDAMFIRPDADLKLAAAAVRFGLQLNRGRTCIAPRRIFVPRQLLKTFTNLLRDELEVHPPIQMDDEACRRWLPWVREALAADAFIVAGRLRSDSVEGPLIIGGARPESTLMQNDTFAPVAGIVPVGSDEEALAADALCPFALGASVFGRNPAAARKLAHKIRAGSVVINDLIAPTADPRVPFGGLGRSGFGSTRGDEGFLEMTVPKVIIRNTSGQRRHYDPLSESDTPLFRAFLNLLHGRSMVTRIRELFAIVSIFKNSTNKRKDTSS